MARLPSWILVPVSVVLALVVSAATLMLGLRVHGSGFVDPLPRDRAPDYGFPASNGFPQLSADYIAKILGKSLIGAGSRPSAVPAVLSATRAAGGRSRGRVVLTHEATNDDWASALQIPSLPFTARTNTSRATRETGEPGECAPVGGTVWYRYAAPQDEGLIANTFGSRYSTSLNIFTGTRLGDLRSIGCDTDAEGASIVSFSAKASTTYYFQITGPVGGGDLVFNVEPPGTTTRASVNSSGDEGNSGSGSPLSVSADGRYVTFASFATNLVPGFGETRCSSAESQVNWGKDTAGRCPAVFVHDRVARKTTPISVNSSGEKANDASWNSSVSEDGRYVAFESLASNLVTVDANGVWDVFVRDLIAGTTERVSVSTSGGEASDPGGFGLRLTSGSGNGAISADGRFVAFNSWADNLVAGDTPGQDIFVRDRLGQTTEIVSISDEGRNGDGISDAPSISSDGRYVAFQSRDSTLVAGDSNLTGDVFVHDRARHSTIRASIDSSGREGNDDSFASLNEGPGLSGNGRYVAYYSWATNLVEGDNNNTIDVFVHDLVAKTTIRVSVSSAGQETSMPDPLGVGIFPLARMSHDGRYVSFVSNASDLVPGKRDANLDVFIHDLVTKTTTRISTSPTGEGGNGYSSLAWISADGTTVAFYSSSSNLVSHDRNESTDVFVFERVEES